MSKFTKLKTVFFVFFLLFSSITFGQIAAWNFTGSGNYSTYAATTFNPNLVSTSGANNITRGTGANSSTGANSFRTQGFSNDGISILNPDYFQITLSANIGYKLSLSTIDAKFDGTPAFYASPGVTSQFAYSLDGTTFTLIDIPVQSTTKNLTQIILSGISDLQNIPSGAIITLRYYASGQTPSGGWGFCSTSTVNGLAIGGTVTAQTSSPTITVTEVTIPNMKANVGRTITETVNVSGVNLTGNIAISIIDDTNNQFDEPSVTSINKLGDNTATGTVTVTYRPTSSGNHSATLKLESSDATTITKALSGNATIPSSIPNVIITEVYGGGGNSGATYQNDFVELYNRTEGTIDISGWSVQYYTEYGSGTSSNVIEIPSGKSIAGNRHFLI